MRISLPSFAKINWDLRILGRRPDGFHELDTVFQTVDLTDRLEFELAEAGVTLDVCGDDLPSGPANLVVRAAERYLERAGRRSGVSIRLSKRIPVGAGLGGGSSNAAVTLLALQRLIPGVPTSELQHLAADLGSDVPYFLTGGLAWGRGRGEIIRDLPDGGLELPVLLIRPGFPVSTREAYAWLKAEPLRNLTNARPGHTMRAFAEILRAGRWGELRNDLEGPVLAEFPTLTLLKRGLPNHGCDWAMLSGSGSVVFATGELSRLQDAGQWCRESGLGESIICRTVPRAEYRRRLLMFEGEPAAGHDGPPAG